MTAGYDAMPFRVSVVRAGRRAVVRITGELDCATAPGLERAFADLLADGRPDLVIDAAELAFTDVVGAGVLIDAAEQLAPSGQLTIRNAGGQLVRVLTLLGYPRLLDDQPYQSRGVSGSSPRSSS